MPINIDVWKILVVFLLLKGNVQPASINLGTVAYELHKISRFINRLDNLGQLALNAPTSSDFLTPSGTKDNSFPDVNTLMESLGPIISALGTKYNDDENRNAIF